MLTEKELFKKLQNKSFSPKIIDKVLLLAKEANLINNKNYIQEFIDYRLAINPCGLLKIKQDLYPKGINGEMVEQIWQEKGLDEKKIMIMAIDKKFGKDKVKQSKLINFLKYRGFFFSFDDVREFIE